MTTVLVVDDDADLARTVMRQIERRGAIAEYASSCDDALQHVEHSAYDVLLTDLDLGEGAVNGIELIRRVRQKRPAMSAILMSAIASARDYKSAIANGAVDVLVKPFSPEELDAAIERALECDKGFHGNVHGVELVELLQLYHFSRRAVAVRVDGEPPGFVDMRDGEIVDARCGDARGEDALGLILGRTSGGVTTSALKEATRTIERRFDQVLMDAIRLIDEGGVTAPSSDADAFEFDLGLDEEFKELETEPTGEQEMGKIDESCKQVVNSADGGIACGVVDLDTGMLLGIHNNAQYTQSLNEIVAAAAVEMFRGSNVGRIEKSVRTHRGVPEDGARYIEEVQFSSKNNYHFCKTIKNGRAVIILVTNKSTNVGMGWASLKSVIGDVEPLVP